MMKILNHIERMIGSMNLMTNDIIKTIMIDLDSTGTDLTIKGILTDQTSEVDTN